MLSEHALFYYYCHPVVLINTIYELVELRYLTSECHQQDCEEMTEEVGGRRHQSSHPVWYRYEHADDNDDDQNFRRKYRQKIRAEPVNSRHSFAPDHPRVVCHWRNCKQIKNYLDIIYI